MKSFALISALACLAVASPLTAFVSDQQPLVSDARPQSHPGFDLDLSELRLVQLGEDEEPVWMTELDKVTSFDYSIPCSSNCSQINLKAEGVNFFDITDTQSLGSTAHLRASLSPTFPSPSASALVNPVLKKLSTDGPKKNLETLTNFRTRHYRSDITSQNAPESLQDLISISEFSHSWGQNTIIARINGSSATDDRTVIIGAHQDSTNMWPFLPAPGADDDGSGTVTILESYRALISSNFRPVRPVEFHWYSAEEGGLLGSREVAREYEGRSANVYAMSQFDMTAWVKQGTKEEVGIIMDYTDSALTEFNKKLVKAYLDIPYVETKCGASWGKAGYPSVFTIESTFENSNQLIHTARDRSDVSPEFSFEHMLEFSKLAVAFAIELGGWNKQ
ncbi:hypothetical protein NLI96_g10793 [Meripilus lineatus]|uniref:Peptide hydrolase n=1 Tax=Meripilus lineatus TaxID=2056292 RepID=A0AAD5YE03_9APHY|nr:hypothetical protein NLI96_g10793 [Physisporinus lineatus]